ncbi:MAG: hypothetical protein JO356_07140 [Acidobacteria bacterium]|nr:hypothetical protein [Acidobacteriota bacterium]
MKRTPPRIGLIPVTMMVCLVGLAGLCAPSLSAVAETVPIMDGGAGPCSLELTVTTADGKPVYAAIIKVHIAYGFGGIRKLDLEAGSNSEGKVKFTGLPARVHGSPLEFHAAKDDLEGVASYDPAAECEANHGISLVKPKNDDAK